MFNLLSQLNLKKSIQNRIKNMFKISSAGYDHLIFTTLHIVSFSSNITHTTTSLIALLLFSTVYRRLQFCGNQQFIICGISTYAFREKLCILKMIIACDWKIVKILGPKFNGYLSNQSNKSTTHKTIMMCRLINYLDRSDNAGVSVVFSNSIALFILLRLQPKAKKNKLKKL